MQTSSDLTTTEMGSSSSSSSSSTTSTTTEPKPLCNFVFPKFLGTSEDPVDELLLQQQQGDGSGADENNLPSPDVMKFGIKDWELQEAILGQYLIFDEDEDNFEAV